jgi:diguanylate cyclase (GGDEF)-like protein
MTNMNLDRRGHVEIAAERFRSLFAANTFGMLCGVGDRITEANAAFLDWVGIGAESVDHGLQLSSVLQDHSPGCAPVADGEGREYEVARADGTMAYVLAAFVRVGAEESWVALVVDLTARKATERAIAHLAMHDPVTGLPNRRALVELIRQALTRANRREREAALLFCDLDHFKRVNDVYGHSAGDEILRAVARRLESVLRGDDAVARVGGDEFVVVLQELADPTEATRIAERARLAVASPIPLADANTTVHVTASIGVAVSRPPHDDGDRLLGRADNAMYLAKQRGRDQVAFEE